MYNFSIPSQLKAWIDRVVIAGKTSATARMVLKGCCPKDKKVFIASSRGNVYAPGSPAAAFEHHESYLTGVLSFIGLTNVTVVRAEGLDLARKPKRRHVEGTRTHRSHCSMSAKRTTYTRMTDHLSPLRERFRREIIKFTFETATFYVRRIRMTNRLSTMPPCDRIAWILTGRWTCGAGASAATAT